MICPLSLRCSISMMACPIICLKTLTVLGSLTPPSGFLPDLFLPKIFRPNCTFGIYNYMYSIANLQIAEHFSFFAWPRRFNMPQDFQKVKTYGGQIAKNLIFFSEAHSINKGVSPETVRQEKHFGRNVITIRGSPRLNRGGDFLYPITPRSWSGSRTTSPQSLQ